MKIISRSSFNTKRMAAAATGPAPANALVGQARYWAFTYWPQGEAEKFAFQNMVESPWTVPSTTAAAFIQWQLETAPTTGGIHMQGFVQYPQKKTLGGVLKDLGLKGAHLEPTKASRESNLRYTEKCDTRYRGPWTYGQLMAETIRVAKEPPAKKAKTAEDKQKAHEDMIADIKSGMSHRELTIKYPRLAFSPSACATLIALHTVHPVIRTVKSYYVWSPTPKIGKTTRAIKTFPNAFIVQGDYGNHSFMGYGAQKIIIFDGFDWHHWPATVLEWIVKDIVAIGNIKGGAICPMWELVIFTSNYSLPQGSSYNPFRQRIADRTFQVDTAAEVDDIYSAIAKMNLDFCDAAYIID